MSEEQNQMTDKEWSLFVHGSMIAFMQSHGIESMNVDTRNGKKAKVSRGKNGEWKVQTIFEEIV